MNHVIFNDFSQNVFHWQKLYGDNFSGMLLQLIVYNYLSCWIPPSEIQRSLMRCEYIGKTASQVFESCSMALSLNAL